MASFTSGPDYLRDFSGSLYDGCRVVLVHPGTPGAVPICGAHPGPGVIKVYAAHPGTPGAVLVYLTHPSTFGATPVILSQ